MERYLNAPNRPAYMVGPPNPARLQCSLCIGQKLAWRANLDNGPALYAHNDGEGAVLFSLGEATTEQLVEQGPKWRARVEV